MATRTQPETSFVSLGGVWLDEIHRPGQPIVKDVVGGSATYAALGMRFFKAKDPASIALVINAGHDFPGAVLEQLQKWNVTVTTLVNAKKGSTRGILEHLVTGGSKFTRLTPPLLTSPADIASAGALNSEVFHTFAVPDLIQSQVLQLKELRQQAGISERPLVIWEPHPKSCTPAMRKEHLALLHDSAVTIFSPNHHELNSFFDPPGTQTPFDRSAIEERAYQLFNPPRHLEPHAELNLGVQAIIIRAAEHGCLILARSPARAAWLPAYFSANDQEQVIDPTGAGNAFLGGLAAGWLATKDWTKAAAYGTVAASVVIEHVGPPTPFMTETGGAVVETWGGAMVAERLEEYMQRRDVLQALKSI